MSFLNCTMSLANKAIVPHTCQITILFKKIARGMNKLNLPLNTPNLTSNCHFGTEKMPYGVETVSLKLFLPRIPAITGYNCLVTSKPYPRVLILELKYVRLSTIGVYADFARLFIPRSRKISVTNSRNTSLFPR